MKKISLIALLIGFCTISIHSNDFKKSYKSKIVAVKLYQNQAKITRKTTIKLQRGKNHISLIGLPKNLYDWSVKSSLPKYYKGKILSLEVAKKALLKKREKRIQIIEDKLKKLRERDLLLVDKLKNIKDQQKFLQSITEFTKVNASKELSTRIPQIKVWENTLNYVSRKKGRISIRKRKIEKRRELIGKKIQKWEFELSQIAGYRYYRNYQSLNKVILNNRSNAVIQQFGNIQNSYAEQIRLLRKPTGKVQIEKQVNIIIVSKNKNTVNLYFDYVIPGTYWKMKYDVRASNEKKKLNLIIYSNIYQKTGENWKNIKLTLSTGSPVTSITPPTLYPWYVDILRYYPRKYSKRKYGGSKADYFKSRIRNKKSYEKNILDGLTSIKEKGPFFEISLPLKQTILSSAKYQKKYIKDYNLKKNDLKFYYEISPQVGHVAYLRIKVKNTTNLPWLKGISQIFLENEYMGKTTIPYTPQGKSEDFVIGTENRISANKELVKKFEDTSGMFGGNRRISYEYKLTIENNLKQGKTVVVYDAIPVSQNKKIEIEIKDPSIPFDNTNNFAKSSKFKKGIRRWKLFLGPNSKKEITYRVIIIFDKDVRVKGLK